MTTRLFIATSLVLFLSACTPEVGSDAWCKKMVDTPKGDWSANDVTSFTKHCVLKTYD